MARRRSKRRLHRPSNPPTTGFVQLRAALAGREAAARPRVRRWVLAILGSLLLHGGVTLGLSRLERAAPTPPPPTRIEVVWTEPPPPELLEPEAQPLPPTPAPPRRTRPRAVTPTPSAPLEAPEAPVPSSEPQGGGPAVASEGGVQGPAAPTEGSVRDPARVDLTLRAAPPGPELVRRARPGPRGPQLNLRPDGKGGYVVRDGEFTALIGPDGTIAFKDKTALQRWHGVSYEIDVTDVVMRIAGDDPYRHAKLRVLQETAGLRAELAAQACEERLRTSLAELQGKLTTIWEDPGLAVDRRRALLFKMWDDCAEDGDEEVLTHANQARATIEAFVQKHLPEGSSFAFTEAELFALNERRISRARFEPYRGRRGTRP